MLGTQVYATVGKVFSTTKVTGRHLGHFGTAAEKLHQFESKP